MPICYHCGQEGPLIKCAECGQEYCSLHREPINHDCNIVRESANLSPYQPIIPQTQVASPSYVAIESTTPGIQEQVRQQQTPSTAYQSYLSDQGASPSPSGSSTRGTTDGSYTWYHQEKLIPPNAFDPDSGIKFKGILWAHKSEFFHLLVGAALIFIIGLISFYPQIRLFNDAFSQLNAYGVSLVFIDVTWMLFMIAGFYTLAFLFHEFGHRQVAKHFGLQTKFRLLSFGMILTMFGIISGLSSLLIGGISLPSLALPGAVVVLGLDKIDNRTGWCKSAGPLVNLVFGTILLTISLMIDKELFPLNYFLGVAAFLNFMLGAFNMIPVGILDGQNILKWSKGMFFFLLISLVLCLILTISCLYSPVETSPYFSETIKPFLKVA